MGKEKEVTRPNLLVSIAGSPKTGKTHLAFTFPEPIKVFSFDFGARLVASKFKGKQIDIVEYPLPIMDTLSSKPYADELEKMAKQVRKDIAEAIDSGEYKTVVIDTLAALWEIIRLAAAAEENRDKLGRARDYGEVNVQVKSIFTRAALHGVNLVVISYLKDKYVDDKPTGSTVIDGWKHTEGAADICLQTRRESRSVKGDDGKFAKKNVVVTTVTDSRFDLDSGQEYDMLDYETLAALLGI